MRRHFKVEIYGHVTRCVCEEEEKKPMKYMAVERRGDGSNIKTKSSQGDGEELY